MKTALIVIAIIAMCVFVGLKYLQNKCSRCGYKEFFEKQVSSINHYKRLTRWAEKGKND
jgi:hypothetical protein